MTPASTFVTRPLPMSPGLSAPTPQEDPAREAVIRDPGRLDRLGTDDAGGDDPERAPTDPDAPGRGLDETDDPIPEPNEPA